MNFSNCFPIVRLILLATLFSCLALPANAEQAQQPPLLAKGAELASRFFGSLETRDASEVGPLLAPGFQIVRASGTVHSRDEYLATFRESESSLSASSASPVTSSS